MISRELLSHTGHQFSTFASFLALYFVISHRSEWENTQDCFHVSVLPIHVTATSAPLHAGSSSCVALNALPFPRQQKAAVSTLSHGGTEVSGAPALILQLLWQQFSIDAVKVIVSVCLLSIKWLWSVVSCCYISLCHQGQLTQEIQMLP